MTSIHLRHNKTNTPSEGQSLILIQSAETGQKQHRGTQSAIPLTSMQCIEPCHNDCSQISALNATTSTTVVRPTPAYCRGQSSRHITSDIERERTRLPERADIENPAPFTFRSKMFVELVDSKSILHLKKLGGPKELVKGLGTDKTKGLSAHALGEVSNERSGGGGAYGASLEDRRRVYGNNMIPVCKSKSLLQLVWIALQDKVQALLFLAAVISLALGLYQDIDVHKPVPCSSDMRKHCPPPRVVFFKDVAIIVAVIIVTIVGSLNDWQKERQFKKLDEMKEDRTVKVIRMGKERQINAKDIVVGDIATVEPGEIIPCDGIFLSGHNVKCDESTLAGEHIVIRKFTYEDVYTTHNNLQNEELDCFMLSGAKVLEGVGTYIVIATGEHSFNGRIMTALHKPVAATPLQEKLNALAELTAKVGVLCGILFFAALTIKFSVQSKTKLNRSANMKVVAFVQIVIISVTLVVVAVPGGLPLVATLALAFATKRMTKKNLLVRVLDSCEIMANATVVCTDKTGTLTQNVMTVIAGSLGIHAKFVRNLRENNNRVEHQGDRKHPDDFAIEQSDLNKIVPPALQACFNEAICLNSTACKIKNKETGEVRFVGSETEAALLRFAKELGWKRYRRIRESAKIVQVLPFDRGIKYTGVVVKKGNGYRVYFKGASEILIRQCSRHVVVRKPDEGVSGSEDDEIETKQIDEKTKENIANTIIFYANQMLRTIALCYRDVEQWPPAGKGVDEVPLSELAENLTLIGITGIEDPLRPSVRDAISDAARAGVTVKMCTGDNVLTARSIAAQCGIYTPGGVIMEGPVFRKLSVEERNQVAPYLQVLARSSPEDKKILVETLMKQGEVVGVTGDGTNDGPALKEANVGFSMGIAGTEVAKEASDIILMDDNFASIVSAIIWGRCVNDAVRKFLQFQISVNICAVLITFISAVASSTESSVLTAVQLLWINIIMDTFAALALATDPATRALLDRKPDRRAAPLFTVEMGKMIIGQALYQTFIVLLFHFGGPKFFNVPHIPHSDEKLSTLVFNIFVWCQIFNSINCRTIDGTKNVFAGIHRNYYFISITLIEIAIQVTIVFFGGPAFNVSPINGKYWAISIALGLVSLPLGYLIRLIPNKPIEKFLIAIRVMKDPAKVQETEPDKKYNDATVSVVNTLNIFSNIRGGRVKASSIALDKKNEKKRIPIIRHDSVKCSDVKFPSLITMVHGLVGSSTEVYRQSQRDKLHDPANEDPSRSSIWLLEGGPQLHPGTGPGHPVWNWWKRWSDNHDVPDDPHGIRPNTAGTNPNDPTSRRHNTTSSGSSTGSDVSSGYALSFSSWTHICWPGWITMTFDMVKRAVGA